MKLQIIIVCEIAFALISFTAMRIDKLFAKKKHKRISEATLLFLTFVGPIGTLASMCLPFVNGRHKSKKSIFWLTVIISCAIHILDIYLLLVEI